LFHPPSWARGWTIAPHAARGELRAPLTFADETVSTQRQVDPHGRVRITTSLGGLDSDARVFWDAAHQYAVTNEEPTPAQWLDTRADADDDPPAGALPETINPLALFTSGPLRGTQVIRLEASAGLRARYFRAWQFVKPAHSSIVFFLRTKATTDAPESLDFAPVLHRAGFAALTSADAAPGTPWSGVDLPPPVIRSSSCQ